VKSIPAEFVPCQYQATLAGADPVFDNVCGPHAAVVVVGVAGVGGSFTVIVKD
jgi:hypothetical protein